MGGRNTSNVQPKPPAELLTQKDMKYAVVRNKKTKVIVSVAPFENTSDLGGSGYDASKNDITFEDSRPENKS